MLAMGAMRSISSLLRNFVLRAWWRAQGIVRVTGELFEDQWFDRTRRVRTSGNASLRASGIAAEEAGDSEWYMPARPRHIRAALRALPVEDLSAFTYIDLGCGKGRSLFVAAECGFRRIVGVELSPVLYVRARENIGRFRARRFRAGASAAIEAVHQNAREFAFPEGDLVIYMFNPFGADTMQRVLENLDDARRRRPRRVVVILLWPRCGEQVAAVKGMRLLRECRQYRTFEAPALRVSEANPSTISLAIDHWR